MAKFLTKKYLSEDAVKRALKIDSFRNLSKDRIMQFVSMIPYMDKEVAIAIINQFPTFADFGKTAISTYSQMCEDILEKNKESQAAAIQGHQKILDALSERMKQENVSEEERKAITNDMVSVADKIAEIDFQNKKFLDRMSTKVLAALTIIVALIGGALGIKSAIGSKEDIPELPDDEDDDL